VAGTSEIKAGWTAAAGVGVVALTAAVISFSHVRRLALDAGETPLAAWLLPVSIDGAIVAAVAVILADSRAGRRPAGLTWVLLTLGLAGSLAANIASAEPTVTARAVAAWPPLGLALGIEVLASLVRRQRASQSVIVAAQPAATLTAGHEPAEVREAAEQQTPAQQQRPGSIGRRQLADADAIRAIRQLDAASPSGRATRLAIQERLGCGGSKAARLAELARRPAVVPAPREPRGSVAQFRQVPLERAD